MLNFSQERYAVPINAPTSLRINNVDLRAFAFELETLPETLFAPPADARVLGFEGLHGARDFGNRKAVWTFSIQGRIHGLTFDDMLKKRDMLLAWINDQQYVTDEFINSQQSVPSLWFELAGAKWYFDQEVLLVENASKTVYGGRRIVSSGTTDGTTASKLVDSGATFTTDDIEVNDVVFNTTDTTGAIITAIDDDNNLSLDRDIMVSGEGYEIRDSPKWTSFLKEDNEFRISGDTTKYRTESITHDAKVVLDTAIVRASASGISYQAERRRYLLVNYDGTSTQGQQSSSGFMSHESIDKTYTTRANTTMPVTISFRAVYPWWIGDCLIEDFGQVANDTFLELRGVGNGEGKPIYNIIGAVTNPRITAAEMAFHSVFNCNLTATDLQNISFIDGTAESSAESALSGKVNSAFTFAADSVFSVETMKDGSAPTGAKSDRLSRRNGKISLWVKPDWNSADDTTDRFLFKDSAATNELTIKWDGTAKEWQASDGTGTATSADTFSASAWINIQVAWSNREDVDTSVEMQIYVDGVAGTGVASYLSDIPGTLMYIGGQDTGLLGFTGDIDDFGIYDYWGQDADFTTEVADIYNSGTGQPLSTIRHHDLIFHLPFDTSTNPIANDRDKRIGVSAIASNVLTVAANGTIFRDNELVLVEDDAGQGSHAVIAGTPTATSIIVDDGAGGSPARMDSVGISVAFDGASYYDAGTTSSGDVSTGDLGVSILAKTTASSIEYMACKIDAASGSAGWYLRMNADGTVTFYMESTIGTTMTATSTVTINDGRWHHIFFANDRGSTSHLFVDGELEVAAASFGAQSTTNAVATRIGALGDGGATGKWTGELKDYRFYGNGATTFMAITTNQKDMFEIGAFPIDSKTVDSRAADVWYKMVEAGVATTLTDSGTDADDATVAGGTTTRTFGGVKISNNLIVDYDMELAFQAGWGTLTNQTVSAANSFFRKAGNTVANKNMKDEQSVYFESAVTLSGFYKKILVPKGARLINGFRYKRIGTGHTLQAFDNTLAAVTGDTGSSLGLETSTGHWQFAEHAIEVADSGADVHEIHIRLPSPVSNSELYVDDWVCKQNLITAASTVADAITGWSPESGAGTLTVSTTEHAGTNAIQFDNSEDGIALTSALTLNTNSWYEQLCHVLLTVTVADFTSEVTGVADAIGDTTPVHPRMNTATNGQQEDNYHSISNIWRTKDSVAGVLEWHTDNGAFTGRIDDMALIERSPVTTDAISVAGSGTTITSVVSMNYVPGCMGCASQILDNVHIQFGDGSTNNVRGYRLKMGFVAKFVPQFASDDSDDHYILAWYDDGTGANAFKLWYDASDDDWVVTIRSGSSDDVTLRTTNTQTFVADQGKVVAAWYDHEGRIDPKDGTRYYGKIFVDGMEAGSITVRPTPPAADMVRLRVGADAPTAASFGIIDMDELGLFVYAPTDRNMVAYSRNKTMRNDNATWAINQTTAASDLLVADTRSGWIDFYDSSLSRSSVISNASGSHPGVRGEHEDEYQTLFVTSGGANIADLEVVVVPHYI